MNDIRYTDREVLNEAIMTGIPAIVVEGREDIRFYEAIIHSLRKRVRVVPVQMVRGYAAGNKSVVDLITNLQPDFSSHLHYTRYLLGIIDKDVRDYRGDHPQHLLGLLILNVYSYEAHLVTDRHIKVIISFMTDLSADRVPKNLVDYVRCHLVPKYEEIYYMSLEALKCAVEPDYQALISYRWNEGRIADPASRSEILSSLRPRIQALEDWAFGMSVTISDLKKFAKGRWLLATFIREVAAVIRHITEQPCGYQTIKQCPFCGFHQQDCLWKVTHFQWDALSQILLSVVDSDEVQYISDRIAELA